ncbi:xylulokinase [Vagococcus zengguangii]|uniref:Xylulose kinase n=1 Tax=Vagococcus zengguangii TaxID=2571750 RepID=A0A4D7CNE3_9ENTE|nr:xylulokinase [Vagococcus zengguangii]QCI85608.1 xylulokinase [Vagococcus zengguangii]
MSYVLGIDLGTSSLKGLLVNKKGEVVATASSDYPLIHEKPGYSEQQPQDWMTACEQVLGQLKEEVADFTQELEGISFSGQMHSLVVLNDTHEVLRPAILWNDVRTTKQCERIMSEFGEEVLAITKNIALEGFTLPKVLWIQEEEPGIWAKVRHMMLPKDYLGYCLTGNIHMDYSDAAGTLMLDIEAQKWSTSILSKFNIPTDYLPQLIDAAGQIGTLLPTIQEKFGFEKEVKVFAGGADNACAALGAGILDQETGMASIGTSGVFLSYEGPNNKGYQGKLHLFNHVIPNAHYSMGVTLAAGHSLNWFKDTFASNESFESLLSDIDKIAPGSDGLLFTPYIVGERTPHADSQIRGSFIGLDTTHSLKHLAKAILEGITFSLKDSQQLMEVESNRKFERIVSVGGGAKNKDWLQMQADIFNAEIIGLETEQGPGMGAAMLAAIGLGWFDDALACAEQFVKYKGSTKPIVENVEKYQQYYELYQQVYPATKTLSHALQALK